MPQLVTLDSSVIIAGLRKQEEYYSPCKALLEAVHLGQYFAVEPYTVLVEIAAAIRRRTGSQELSRKVSKDLQSLSTLFFLDLDAARARSATEIAQRCSVRGMDAIVVQIAQEFNATLVSLDTEMLENVKGLVDCKMPAEVTR